MGETSTAAREQGSPFRLLIVDDNRDAANSLAVLAQLWGYEVRVAYDGESGLEVARAFRPDCLLLDIGMPRLDGCTLARRIRGEPELAGARLIAVTAYGMDEYRQRIEEAGFDHCLIKPVDPDEIERLVKMLEQALRLAEKTEALARQNVELAAETKELLSEAKEEIQEIKADIKEVKQELREVKEEVKEVKNSNGGNAK
jgi:CheY-like chemotaxis protein